MSILGPSFCYSSILQTAPLPEKTFIYAYINIPAYIYIFTLIYACLYTYVHVHIYTCLVNILTISCVSLCLALAVSLLLFFDDLLMILFHIANVALMLHHIYNLFTMH